MTSSSYKWWLWVYWMVSNGIESVSPFARAHTHTHIRRSYILIQFNSNNSPHLLQHVSPALPSTTEFLLLWDVSWRNEERRGWRVRSPSWMLWFRWCCVNDGCVWIQDVRRNCYWCSFSSASLTDSKNLEEKKKHMPGWQDRWTVMGFVRFVKHTLRAARHRRQPCVKQHQCDMWAVPPVHQSSNQLWCNLSIASLINCDKSASCDLDWQLSDWLISTDESSVNHSCVYMHLCCPADHDPGTWSVLFCSKHLSTLWPLVGISVVWFPLRQRTYLAVLLLFMPTLSYFMNKPQVFIIILIIKDIQNIKEHK